MRKSTKLPPQIIGWREWVGLPDLGIPQVKAKIDTGARSSSLHALNVKTFDVDGRTIVRFRVHPLQRDSKNTVECQAEVLEYRWVRSSTGHAQRRPVIVTTVEVLGQSWPIELTLANRAEMGFRMLLGREGVRDRCLVDAKKSFYGGKPKPSKINKIKRRTKPERTKHNRDRSTDSTV